MHKIINKSQLDLAPHQKMIDEFLPHTQQELGYDRPVTIIFISDKVNMGKTLGKTGFYDPTSDTVGLYTDGRHIKDILRSLSHELIHHAQNCSGRFDLGPHTTELGYAQKDPHLRAMERQAYEKGNMLFRDWEDNYKRKKSIKLRITK
jgi:hypothetical protein